MCMSRFSFPEETFSRIVAKICSCENLFHKKLLVVFMIYITGTKEMTQDRCSKTKIEYYNIKIRLLFREN